MKIVKGLFEEVDRENNRRYKTTLSIGRFIEFIGWAVVVIAGILALMGIDKGLWALLPALGIGIGGILIVYTGQLILIFVDIENNTRKTNELLLKQLVSKNEDDV